MSHAPKNNKWQPSAAISTLRSRADILKNIRAFFAERDVLEVETPLMQHASVTDPFIESISANYQSHLHALPDRCFLQTSPEYAMKRLLANHSGSIFQICKAFRQAEHGRMHNPEFTMLEWYRVGFNHLQLMTEVDALLQTILNTLPAENITYQQLFLHHLGIDPLHATLDELKTCAATQQINVDDNMTDCDTWLNLLLSHCIEPTLGADRPCCIYNFPVSQAALARINTDGVTATRFEFYYRGMELANGFHELQNADEQRQRFLANNQKRRELGLSSMPIDEYFLAALQAGLPDCAGVALGIDRLVMLAIGAEDIRKVISFDIERV